MMRRFAEDIFFMDLDECANRVYAYGINKYQFMHDTNYKCPKCWSELGYMYMENRLYLFRCKQCKVVHLVEGESPEDAIQKIAFRIKHIDEWCEEIGICLWWRGLPVEEEPSYIGSPLDANFPHDLKYWLQIAGFTQRGMWD